jgi:predicted amidohydrolase
MQDLILTYLQTDLVWENPQANRLYFSEMILDPDVNSDLIVLPETFTTGFPVDPVVFAETEDGETINWMREMAAAKQAVICGSLLLQKRGKFFNTFVWMPPSGEALYYDKRHVFRMGGEHQLVEAGKENITIALKGWKIRPQICYDLRFPVWSRNRFSEGKHEFDLLIYVANWPAVRAYPWKSLLIARAIENQCFVLGVNRVGTAPGNVIYSGDSRLIGPKGEIISMVAPEASQMITVKLLADELLQFRDAFQVGLDWDSFGLES